MTFEELYLELRRIARDRLRNQCATSTLQPTALVHEYLLSLRDGFGGTPSQNISIARRASKAMAHILIDRARAAKTEKRGGGRTRVPLEAVDGDGRGVTFPDLVLLNDLMDELIQVNPKYAAVVDMRFFCGMGMEEVANALGVSLIAALLAGLIGTIYQAREANL